MPSEKQPPEKTSVLHTPSNGSGVTLVQARANAGRSAAAREELLKSTVREHPEGQVTLLIPSWNGGTTEVLLGEGGRLASEIREEIEAARPTEGT